jgi:hypothetical protein
MNVRSIIEIFRRVPQVKMPLGRWNIHNYSETILKVQYATEDNCGVAHNIKQKTEFEEDNEYIYMMGYESVHK